jgi:pimeloyl-ACP methyl ester carboxylesterase
MLQRPACPIAYDIAGAGEPVLFIQGVGVHGAGWKPQVEELATDHACLTFDNRGMGRSVPLQGRPTMEAMVADAEALLHAAGWDSAHVVGHSMGGLIALELALRARARVRSLALLCTFPRGTDATALTARMLWLGLRSNLGTRRMRRHAFLEIILPPHALVGADRDALAAKWEPLFGHDLGVQPPIAMRQLSAMRGTDTTPRLGELAGLPTLILSALHDPIARPAIARAMATKIPGARHVEFPDASHGLPIHDAPRVNALLREHFQGSGRAHR